jgi:competence ComEA-like helix-hairpin-helix protein
MNSRQRGAAIVLAVLVSGRILDRFDLGFENHAPIPAGGLDSLVALARTPPGAVPARNAPRHDAATAATDSAPGPPGSMTRVGDSGGHPSHNTQPEGSGLPVAVNAATVADLQRLPGVGPVLAQRILDERRAHGAFHSLADLRRVKGIGPRVAARLAASVRFD